MRLGLRAKVWLGLIAVRSFAYAYTYGLAHHRLTGVETFEVVVAIAPIGVFSAVFTTLGVCAVIVAIEGSEAPIRAVGVAAVMFQLLFGLAIIASGTWSPAGVSMVAVAVMDALALSMPFQRVPKIVKTE